MELNLYANLVGKKGLPYPVVNFDMKSAEILQGHTTISIHYNSEEGWTDLHGRQYRVTSKPHTFNPLRLVK
ncbi:hypothetical protein UFOVP148_22 [uncultured Caudovirales phage]|uniref:Uncharacterized protein n=1 Tax=uncultured Caudovirales phage TaxID=2100421 RepID=A0A6J7W4T5_9CAUD|nr:hypothetical protein UFOVP148_22 [uncultured Caudovirales phage]